MYYLKGEAFRLEYPKGVLSTSNAGSVFYRLTLVYLGVTSVVQGPLVCVRYAFRVEVTMECRVTLAVPLGSTRTSVYATLCTRVRPRVVVAWSGLRGFRYAYVFRTFFLGIADLDRVLSLSKDLGSLVFLYTDRLLFQFFR